MKKILSIIAITFIFCNYLNAQSDAFFNCSEIGHREDAQSPLVPITHGSDFNEPAYPTPIGSGLLILTSLGIGYVSLKKNRSK